MRTKTNPKNKFFAVFLCVCVFWLSGCTYKKVVKEIDPINPITPQIVEKLVKSRISKGTHKDDVLVFLNQHKFQNSGFLPFGNSSLPRHLRKKIEEGTFDKKEIKFLLCGQLEKVRGDLMNEWSINVWFYFDSKEEVIEYWVFESGSGL